MASGVNRTDRGSITDVEPARVELKLSIGGAGAEEARKRVGLRKRDATEATIWFCDQPRREAGGVHFELFDRGVIVRLRHKDGGDSDTTLKYRRTAPLRLPAGWGPEALPGIRVEGDWTLRSRSVAASLDVSVPGRIIDEAGAAGPPLPGTLFSADQRRFAAALLGDRPVDLDGLRPLGPIRARRWEEAPRDDLGNELGAEHWEADGLEFLELSIRVRFENAGHWLRRFADWAAHAELDVRSGGPTKTQAVLEHFAQRLTR
jgi:hypothetical protein